MKNLILTVLTILSAYLLSSSIFSYLDGLYGKSVYEIISGALLAYLSMQTLKAYLDVD